MQRHTKSPITGLIGGSSVFHSVPPKHGCQEPQKAFCLIWTRHFKVPSNQEHAIPPSCWLSFTAPPNHVDLQHICTYFLSSPLLMSVVLSQWEMNGVDHHLCYVCVCSIVFTSRLQMELHCPHVCMIRRTFPSSLTSILFKLLLFS